jgi:D-arabinose 1-dehydrogenase-like Zn-dependent alcohol dehydrogenase
MVPGHEVAGIVKAVGKNVTKFKVGDKCGIGCLVDSCRTCSQCKKDTEQFCPKMVATYNSAYPDGTKTYGGYGKDIVASEKYVLKWPENLDLCSGAPLLCAGENAPWPLQLACFQDLSI